MSHAKQLYHRRYVHDSMVAVGLTTANTRWLCIDAHHDDRKHDLALSERHRRSTRRQRSLVVAGTLRVERLQRPPLPLSNQRKSRRPAECKGKGLSDLTGSRLRELG